MRATFPTTFDHDCSTGRQARNFRTNVPKSLDLRSSSEQIFSENSRWVPLVVNHSIGYTSFYMLLSLSNNPNWDNGNFLLLPLTMPLSSNCRYLPSLHCRDTLGSNDGSTRHVPWCKKENNAKPSQGITIHMLLPSSFYELKKVADIRLTDCLNDGFVASVHSLCQQSK